MNRKNAPKPGVKSCATPHYLQFLSPINISALLGSFVAHKYTHRCSLSTCPLCEGKYPKLYASICVFACVLVCVAHCVCVTHLGNGHCCDRFSGASPTGRGDEQRADHHHHRPTNKKCIVRARSFIMRTPCTLCLQHARAKERKLGPVHHLMWKDNCCVRSRAMRVVRARAFRHPIRRDKAPAIACYFSGRIYSKKEEGKVSLRFLVTKRAQCKKKNTEIVVGQRFFVSSEPDLRRDSAIKPSHMSWMHIHVYKVIWGHRIMTRSRPVDTNHRTITANSWCAAPVRCWRNVAKEYNYFEWNDDACLRVQRWLSCGVCLWASRSVVLSPRLDRAAHCVSFLMQMPYINT